MPEKQLYEYAVIRIVPRVEREEFINAGIIMYCAAQRFLQVKYTLRKDCLQAFGNTLNTAEIETRLKAFEQVCNGGREGGPIGLLPQASRFRWLTPRAAPWYKHQKFTQGFVYMPVKHWLSYISSWWYKSESVSGYANTSGSTGRKIICN